MKGPRIVKRKSINTEKDPYLLKLSPGDMALCRKCGAMYHGKRWSIGAKAPAITEGKKRVSVLCPACQKIKDNFPEGYVTIQGAFVKTHKDEILNIIKNKEKIAMRHNPLDRIIGINEKRGVIEVTTTTEKLAQRIGQIIGKAFGGDVEYKWSSDVKLARVVWTREA